MKDKNINIKNLLATSEELASKGKTPMFIAIDEKNSWYNRRCRYS